MKRIIIVGGGLTGLSAAYYLQKTARAAGQTPEIIVLDRGDRLGGKVQTEQVAGLTIEEGPDSFLARKPWLTELCQELGLPLVGQNTQVRKVYIVRAGHLVPMFAKPQVIIPTDLRSFLGSPLLSWRGKLRALCDLVIPRRRETGDESMGAFVTRRFGPEFLQRIAAPMLAGIYAGDTHNMSLQATFPQFAALERKGGSLIRAARKAPPPQGATGSAFQSVPGGLRTIIDALVAATPAVLKRTGAAVASIAHAGAAWTVALDGGETLTADAVVLTTPGFEQARLLESVLPAAATELAAVPYNSATIVSLAYRPADLPAPLDATGFLVPKGEAHDITAATFATTKWPNTTDGTLVLIRGYLGRAGGRDWARAHPHAAVLAVRADFQQLMGITAEPVLARVYPYPLGLPQYRVGHLERMAGVRRLAAQVPGLVLVGAVYNGAGLPDCVREGSTAAAQVAAQFGWTPYTPTP